MNKGNILDPSSGAIGIRLNKAKTIFIKTKNIIALLSNSGILTIQFEKNVTMRPI